MSIQFDIATDRLTGTGFTGSVATITGWLRMQGDPTTQYGWLALRSSGALQLAMVNDTSNVMQAYDAASVNQEAGTLSWRVWYKFAIVCNGTTWTIYHADEGSTLASVTVTRTALSSPNQLYLGDEGTGVYAFGRFANFKIYTAALTQTEIETELGQYPPARTANLVRYHPFHVSQLTDYSGNGADLTAGTTPATTAADPGEPVDPSGVARLQVRGVQVP